MKNEYETYELALSGWSIQTMKTLEQKLVLQS